MDIYTVLDILAWIIFGLFLAFCAAAVLAVVVDALGVLITLLGVLLAGSILWISHRESLEAPQACSGASGGASITNPTQTPSLPSEASTGF